MIPTSLRWRLPLTYAAVALIATLALGAILLTILSDFYRRQELAYLSGNAAAIGLEIMPSLTNKTAVGALQAQVEGLAFLSQTRIKVLDDNKIQLLADSGDLLIADVSTSIFVNVIVDEVEQTFSQENGEAGTSYRSSIVITDGPFTQDRERMVIITGTESATESPLDLGVVSQLPAVGTPYGFGLNPDVSGNDERSSLVVEYPVLDARGSLVGFVELSQGPAYGRAILRSVAWGGAVAGLIAMLLAAAIGWLVSRRLSAPLLELVNVTERMTAGDLTARADVARRDEIGALGRSFNQMAGQMEETIMTLRHFIADAAHELHTPLTALRTNLEVIAANVVKGPQAERVARTQAQVNRLQELTSGLLDLSRIEAETAVFQPTDFAQLVAAGSEMIASQAEQKGVDFRLNLPEKPVIVIGDPAQLSRAVHNLLGNSVKFTPAGGCVTVTLQVEGKWAELSVADTGIGIPDETLPQLFGRFHRGRNAAAYPGSGLGLAIVKAIVEKHGGRITAAKSRQGATFLLRLKAVSSER